MQENPYEPPRFDELPRIGSDGVRGEGTSGLTEAEIRAFVSRNASYYLKKWPSASEQYGQAKGFNWTAFLLSGLWLPYRKMYRVTFLMMGFLVVEQVVEEIAVGTGLANQQSIAGIGRLVGLGFSIVCGAFGNAWYLAHARRQIGMIRGRDLPDEDYYGALARRGGTNLPASLGIFCLFIVAMVAAMVAIELMLPAE